MNQKDKIHKGRDDQSCNDKDHERVKAGDDISELEGEFIKRLEAINAVTTKKISGSKLDKAFLIIPIVALTISFLSFSSKTSNTGVLKDKFKSDLSQAITNGADLRAVKQMYVNRHIESTRNITSLFQSGKEYYTVEAPLSIILEDIRTDLFINGNRNTDNKININIGNLSTERLDSLISEYNQKNPFDRLESSQKDAFENLQLKLSDRYDFVKSDINKIADELVYKNALVDKYLNSSNYSFWISVFAFAFALVMSSIQIYMNRSSKVQALVGAAVAKAIVGREKTA